MKTINNYTLQFSYDGKDYSAAVHSWHNYKAGSDQLDNAFTIAKAYLVFKNVWKEGVTPEHYRLIGKDFELIWSSDTKEE